MGGPGSGGPRAGKPGQAYSNRSDLNRLPVRTTSNQTYGKRSAQESAQRVVPMGTPTVPPPSSALSSTPLSAPTTRPAEPVTAGLPTGPGPGPEILGMASMGDPAELELRALYALYPNADILGLLEELDRGAGQF